MSKLKTKKTLMKRIRISRRGKIIKKKTSIGHLKVKVDASRHSRKAKRTSQLNIGHRKLFKRLLAKAGRTIQ